MARKLVHDYTFTPSGRQVVLNYIYKPERLLMIVNATDNITLYQFNSPTLNYTSINYNYTAETTTIILAYDTTSMSSADKLQIYVDEDSISFKPDDTFVDPVSKIRVSNPENLIDTDFEYGLQSQKWETLEQVKNIPTFFSRSGDVGYQILAMNILVNSDVVTVELSENHNLAKGTPVIVIGSKSITCDGGFVATSILSNTKFQYKAKSIQNVSASILDQYTQIFPGSVYQGTEFDLSGIEAITTDGASLSTLTVNTAFPTNFSTGTSFYLTNSIASVSSTFDVETVITRGYETTVLATANSNSFTVNNFALKSVQPYYHTGLTTIYFSNNTIDINLTDNVLELDSEVSFENGWYVYIVGVGNTAITGLIDKTVYYVEQAEPVTVYDDFETGGFDGSRWLTATGVNVIDQGTGTGSDNNFPSNGSSTKYVIFNTGSGTRELRSNDLNMTDFISLSFDYITGNNINGGSTPSTNELLNVVITHPTVGSNTIYSSTNYSSAWSNITLTIPVNFRISGCRIIFYQFNTDGTNADEIGIDNIRLLRNNETRLKFRDLDGNEITLGSEGTDGEVIRSALIKAEKCFDTVDGELFFTAQDSTISRNINIPISTPVAFLNASSGFGLVSMPDLQTSTSGIYYVVSSFLNRISVSVTPGGGSIAIPDLQETFVIPLSSLNDSNTILFPNHGLSNNSLGIFQTTNGASAPLSNGTYVIEVVNNDKLRFKNTLNGQVVNLALAGVSDSVYQITVDQDILDVDSIFLESNSLNDSQELTYSDNGNKTIPGLIDGGIYYVFQKTTDRIKLAETSAGWSSETLIFTQNFPSSTGINSSMQFYIPGHGLGSGDRVQYLSSTPAIGLTNGAWYYVNRISNDRIRLYREREGAVTGDVDFISVAQPTTGTASVRRADLVDMATRNDSTSRVLLGTYSVETLSLASGNSSLSSSSGNTFFNTFNVSGSNSASMTTDSTVYLTETLETLGDDWVVHSSIASGSARFKTVLRDDTYVYVVGTHQERTSNFYDVCVIAYDYDGVRQWIRTGYSINCDFTVTGAAIQSSTLIGVCGSVTISGSLYPFVVGFNLNTLTFGNIDYQTSFNNYVFTGMARRDNNNSVLTASDGNRATYLVSTNLRTIGTWRQTPNNNMFIDIQSGTKVVCDSNSNGFWMYYDDNVDAIEIVKMNSAGTGTLWSRRIGGVNAERPYGIDIDSNNDVYISGFTASQGNGSNDMLVAKLLGNNGAVVWQKVIGSPSSDIAYAATLRNDQVLALAGISDSTFNEDTTVYDDFETGTFSGSIWELTTGVGIRTPGSGLSLSGGFNNSDKPWLNSFTWIVKVQADDKILIGGGFSALNGLGQTRIARLNSNGTKDTDFTIGSGFNSTVYAIAVQSDGKIVVGGNFTLYNGTTQVFITRLNADGTRDTGFTIGTGFNSTVYAIAVQSDGKILIGGDFTSYDGVSQNRIMRLNSDGTIDGTFSINTGSGFNSTVWAIALQPDGKILVGGFFTSFNGSSCNRIMRLNSDGTADTTFRSNIGTGFDTQVRAVALQSDGKILVGGFFTSFNGSSCNRIMRLNSDGTADTTFRSNIGTGFDNGVADIHLQSDSKIVVCGYFTLFNGTSQSRITRLNTNGTRDTGFSIGTGFNSNVLGIDIQSDDKIVSGGEFTQFNNTSKPRIARLNANGSADTLGISTRHVEFDQGFSRELRTAPIDLTNTTSFSFRYITGSSGNGGEFNNFTFSVQASVNDSGYGTLTSFSYSGEEWLTATLTLPSVYRTDNVRLRFIQNANGTNQDEVGIDDLIFSENSVGSSSGALIELDTSNGDIKFAWRLESISDPIVFYDVVADEDKYFIVGSSGDEFVLLNLDSFILAGDHRVDTVGIGASDGVYTITGIADLDTFTMTSTNQINDRSILIDGLTEVDLSRNALNSNNHYFKTGSQVVYTTSGAALGNLTSGNSYYVIAFSKDWFKLASSFENAEDGFSIPITSHSAGTHTFTTSSVSGDVVGSGTVTINNGGKVLTGVGTLFSSQFSPGDTIKLYQPATTATKIISSVNISTDTIIVTAHGMSDGDPIYFTQDVYDLTATRIYYINTSATGTPADQFTVHASYIDAVSGISKLNLDGATYSAADIIEHIDSIGTVNDAVIQYVNGQTEMVLRDAATETFTDANYAIGTALLVRADGFALHRPYDGGVELIPSGNPDGQMIRQTRKYFRYQSGKGIQVSMAINFSPIVQPESITRPSAGSTNIATVTTRYPHRLTVNRSITITGATVTSGTNWWNGTFTVSTVVDDYNFTITMGGTPAQLSAGGLIEYYVNSWTNSRIKAGLFDDQNGLYFEYDGQNLYAVRRSSVLQISGYSSVTFKSGAVLGSSTKFTTQLAVNDKVVIKGQTYIITNIANDSEMYIMPTYRGTDNDRVIITKIVDTKIAQSSWNADRCDGTGPSGFFLDIHKIQMAYIDYSWYGAGKARFGFKDQRGIVIYCHEFIHNNKQTEAYMRSGNLPARYEIENIGSPTYVPSLAHWGTSVIMDGRFDDDRAYVFTASSNNLSVTGAATLTITGRIETVSTYQIFSNGGYRTAGHGLLIPTSSAVFNNITSGAPVTGANLAANTTTRNPVSTLIVPFQPFQASVLSRIGSASETQGTRNLLLLNRMPTGTASGTSSYTATLSTGATSVVYEQPLISIRLAPSVDTGTPGSLGSREIINRMQLILNSVGILTTHSVEITLRLNGITNNNAWQRVANPSLSQLVYHTTDDTITGGAIIYSFRSQGSSGNINRTQTSTENQLGEVATLGNSILGGDGVFPDGPDVLTVVAKLVEDPSTVSTANPWSISGRISWSESQA